MGAAAVWAAPTVTGLGIAPVAAASTGRACPVPILSDFEGELNFMYSGQLTSGTDLTENGVPFSSDETGFVFSESTPVQIGPGGYQTETAFIPEGTWVCSIYLHASPVTGTNRYRATISVPGSIILGYDGRTTNLGNSDPAFAVPGVNYNGAARGHEWNAGNANTNGDFYGLVAPDTVVIRMAVANCCVDQGRIFVACI